ncbi:MAG: SGNH/GDSL hydrolase family protein [Lautropia sp.]|nr:SGNH/GDSL hydrolase family protein [Lautropia sp.]
MNIDCPSPRLFCRPRPIASASTKGSASALSALLVSSALWSASAQADHGPEGGPEAGFKAEHPPSMDHLRPPAAPPDDDPNTDPGAPTALPPKAPASAPPAESPARAMPPAAPTESAKPVPIPESGLPAQPRGTPDAPASRPPAAPDTDDDAKQVRHCQVPASLQPPAIKLPGLSGALVRNQHDVLVIMLGAEAVNNRKTLWPGSSTRAKTEAQRMPLIQRLQSRLSQDLGELAQQRLKVESMGKPHSTVAEQATLIGKQILPKKPALVIWNLGLSDVSRGQPPGRVARALDKGLAQLRKQRIDTIVVDLPYHPQYEALYRTNDYRQYIRWTMNSHEQPMLRRFDMVDYWDSTGRIDLDSTEPERQAAAGVFIDTCVSYQLSRMIERAVN